MYRILRAPVEAVDQMWYERLAAVANEASEIYYPLEPAPEYLERCRRNFLSHNKLINPDLHPTLADTTLYEQRLAELTELATAVTSEVNELVRIAYTARIHELQDQLRLLLAAHEKDDETFRDMNARIYHGPDPAIFAAACSWLRTFADEQTTHPDTHVRKAARHILDSIPAYDSTNVRVIPPLDTFLQLRALHAAPQGYYAQLFAGITIPSSVTEATGNTLVEHTLANIGSDYGVMESSNVNWGVSHTDRAVIHPPGYHMSKAMFEGVLVHEIGSHLLERINGLRGPLRLLALGLDRYDACNEGRAFLREQLVYDTPDHMLQGNSWRHIITMHLAISLAMGLHDHPYDFVELYHTLNPIDVLWQYLQGATGAAAQEHADMETWKTLTRVMKGTDGTGGAYLKDIVYLEGNVRCWQVATTSPDMILLGDLGKFDITRADHITLLRRLGALPH